MRLLASCGYALIAALVLPGCSTTSASGPSSKAIRRAATPDRPAPGISIVTLDDDSARRTAAFARQQRFADVFGTIAPTGTTIGAGDVLDIAIWEAPPAALFGTSAPGAAIGTSLAQSAGIPQQTVGEDGIVAIPFVGNVVARGQTPREVAATIVARLAGRAHAPQAVVRVAQNESRTATVMGEVGATRRIPLTPRGERLLDALAAAGGSRQSVAKTTIQMMRAGHTAAMPLDAIVRDPAQNVVLAPGDVVTAVFQPYTASATKPA